MKNTSAKLLAIVPAFTVFACGTKVSTSSTIEIVHNLPAGFVSSLRSQIKSIYVILDEPTGSPSLFSATVSETPSVTEDGYNTDYSVNQYDTDINLEGRLNIKGNPFSSSGTSTWSSALAGSPIGAGFYVVGQIWRLNNGVDEKIAEAKATEIEGSGVIQFGTIRRSTASRCGTRALTRRSQRTRLSRSLTASATSSKCTSARVDPLRTLTGRAC